MVDLTVPNATAIATGAPGFVRVLQLQIAGRHKLLWFNRGSWVFYVVKLVVFINDAEIECLKNLLLKLFVEFAAVTFGN